MSARALLALGSWYIRLGLDGVQGASDALRAAQILGDVELVHAAETALTAAETARWERHPAPVAHAEDVALREVRS